MKILITGGAGFIGYNLYLKLRNNHVVTLVDNYSTSRYKPGVLELDLSVYSKMIEKLIKDTDVVYHLAGSVGVKKIDNEHNEALMNSININNVIFPLCQKYNKKLIFASTSEVYGECTDAKEINPLSISSPEFGRGSYACAKLMSEFIIKSYTFPSIICRFFNIVGKGQLSDYGMVVPNFIEKAKNNEDIIVYNNGSQVRSFCDVYECVEMLELLLNDIHNNEIYNIGNQNNNISILDLANIIKTVFNSESKITFKNTDEIFTKQFYEINTRTVCTEKFDRYYKASRSVYDIILSLRENDE